MGPHQVDTTEALHYEWVAAPFQNLLDPGPEHEALHLWDFWKGKIKKSEVSLDPEHPRTEDPPKYWNGLMVRGKIPGSQSCHLS